MEACKLSYKSVKPHTSCVILVHFNDKCSTKEFANIWEIQAKIVSF